MVGNPVVIALLTQVKYGQGAEPLLETGFNEKLMTAPSPPIP